MKSPRLACLLTIPLSTMTRLAIRKTRIVPAVIVISCLCLVASAQLPRKVSQHHWKGAAADPLFLTAPTYGAGEEPSSVAVGDFNRDGRADLVVANLRDNDISILLGNGDGTFQSAMNFNTAAGPQSVAVGDFNSDGNEDVAVADGVGISILLGNGDGTFQPAKNYTLNGYDGGYSVVVGDFNNDGKLDLAVVDLDASVWVLLGNGDGTFQAAVAYRSSCQYPDSVTIGDFNGDGKPDLAVGYESDANQQNSCVGLFLGNGDGTFKNGATMDASGFFINHGDLNADGKLDLVVSGGPAIGVLLGNGDGTFQPAVYYPVYGAGNTPFLLRDLNGDGKLDIAWCDSGGDLVGILLGNGDGSFQAETPYYATDSGPAFIAAGDFNGDGVVDLVTANRLNNDVSVLIGSGQASYVSVIDYTVTSAQMVVRGDFNNDGNTDLALPGVALLLGNGDGTFQPPLYANQPGSWIATGDFNADGKEDLVEIMSYTGAVVLLGNGDGTFQASGTYSLPGAVSVTVGDFNKDGKEDLVIANQNDFTVDVLLGNGDGTFNAPIHYPSGGEYPSFVAVGDFNGDHIQDLAVANYGCSCVDGTPPNLSILLGKGDGSFQLVNTYIENLGNAGYVAVGDFNGDGKEDLAVPGLGVFIGNGDGSFQPPVNYSGGGGGTLAIVDVNGDGKQDVAVPGGVFLGNGDGTFQTIQSYGGVGHSAYSIVSGDFNGDGRPDLATANINNKTVSILTNIASGFLYQATVSPVRFNFGDVPTGVTSPPLFTTLTNRGSSSLAITQILVVGPNKDDFAEGNNCGVSLPPGQSCDISVTFTPSSNTTELATIAVRDNAATSPQNVPMSGTGLGPTVQLSPSSLNFGDQIIGTTSAPQTSTLTNSGNGALSITSIGVSGANSNDFAEKNNCGTSLPAGGSCQITVTFKPSGTGNESANVSVMDNAPNSPQSVPLTGVGTPPTVTFSPPSLTFGPQPVGTSSKPLPVMLSTNGTLQISSIAVSAQFSQTNNCGTGLPAGGNCTIKVTFTPTAPGVQNGTLMITDSGTGSPQSVPLSGTGVQPAVSFSPPSLNFGNQTVNIPSGNMASILKNSGTSTLTIKSIILGGANKNNFAENNNCTSSLPPGGTCQIDVTFTPSSTGQKNATVSVTDNAPGSPQSLPLSGVGVLPAVTLSPPSLKFPIQVIYNSSTPQQATLTNTGAGVLTIAKIGVEGQFAATNPEFLQTSNCGSTLAPGANCTITVTFLPLTKGTISGAISVIDNAPGSPQTLPLSGTGTYVQLTPTSVNFGTQPIHTTSLPKYITFVNKGSGPVNFTGTGITITGTDQGDFAETNNCGTSVASGASCKIKVTFTPSQQGTRTADVSISDDGGGSPQTVHLTGTGTP